MKTGDKWTCRETNGTTEYAYTRYFRRYHRIGVYGVYYDLVVKKFGVMQSGLVWRITVDEQTVEIWQTVLI